MKPSDAFHLPGLGPRDIDRWETRTYEGGVTLRYPALTPHTLDLVIDTLRRGRAAGLAERPVLEIADAIGRAARRLEQPDDPGRVLLERALPAVTGYSPPMVRLGLDRMLADWREDALASLLRAEFQDPAVLDAFRPHPSRASRTRVRAFGPELAFHISAGNVPGVAVTSMIRSLLVKAATLVKTAAGEPLFPAVFARTLADVSPELGRCLAITYWPGGSTDLEEAALRAADTVVVYGGAETEADVRRRVPAEKRLVVHGPRLSVALVGRAALGNGRIVRTAESAARATAIFDQQGCVAPHVVYVERGGDAEPHEFAALVADALARIEDDLPLGRISTAEAAAIQQLRAAAEFRAIAGQDVRLHADERTRCTVIYDAEPDFRPSCLNRTLWVRPLDDLTDAVEHLRPHAHRLQTAGVAGAGGRLAGIAELLGRIGISRITDLDRMPWPPQTWHHDGHEPLRELVRWADLED